MHRHIPIPIRPVPVAALLLAALALGAPAQSEPQSLSDFKIPEYNEKMQLESMLFGDHAQVSRGGKVIDITNVKIEYYKQQDLPEPSPNALPDPDAEEPAPEVDMRITAPHCTYDRRFKAASSPGSVRITAEDMAETPIVLRGHTGPINALAVGPDGRWLVTWTDRYRDGHTGTNGYFDAYHSAIILDLEDRASVWFFGHGCEPMTPPTGDWLYHVCGGTFCDWPPDIYKMKITDRQSRSSYQPEMAHEDADWGHEYFPRISNDGAWIVYGATTGCHDQDTCDYEIFIHRVDLPEITRVLGEEFEGLERNVLREDFVDLFSAKFVEEIDQFPRKF